MVIRSPKKLTFILRSFLSPGSYLVTRLHSCGAIASILVAVLKERRSLVLRILQGPISRTFIRVSFTEPSGLVGW